jgi:hypothetical protein
VEIEWGDEWRFVTGTTPTTSDSPDWVRVESSAVAQPFWVRLAKRGGRLRVLGLVVDNGEEVTADLLRSIRLGQLVEEFFDNQDEVDQLALGGFVDQLPELPTGEPRARRGNPPSDDDLRTFVAAFRLELGRHPRRAMHEVTKKGGHVPMARSTGYRWLTLARERGLYQEDDS